MKVTIKDIAKRTGYSINTVSRALKGKPDVKEATKQTILAAAHEMGYVANALAGSLRSSRRNVIGVLLSADSANPVFAEMIQGIENYARSRGFSIILINTEQDVEKQKTGTEVLLSQQVDGLIIMPVADPSITEEQYLQLPCPFVFLGRNLGGLSSHSVMFDDIDGAAAATSFFLNRNLTKILFLEGPAGFCSSIDRKQGYFNAYRQHGLEADERYCFTTDGHMQGGYDAVVKAVEQSVEFESIFAYNDLVGYGALRALKDLKIAVPEQVQIIGYDNLEISRFFSPRLTSMETPRIDIGRIAAEELINHIQDENYPYKNISLQATLVPGETVL